MCATEDGELMKRSAGVDPRDVDTIFEAQFSQAYPHLLVTTHVNSKLMLWDMQQQILPACSLQLEALPLFTFSSADGLLVTVGCDGHVFEYRHDSPEEVPTREFSFAPEKEHGVVSSIMHLSGRHIISAGKDFVSVFDLETRNVVWETSATFPETSSLLRIVSVEESKFAVLAVDPKQANAISTTTVEFDRSPPERNRPESASLDEKEIEGLLLHQPEEDTHLEQEDEKTPNTAKTEAEPAQPKKKWKSQATLHAEETAEPRAGSILVPANIAIKEKSIYDVDAKEIAKSKKKGAILLVSMRGCSKCG